MSSNCPGLYFDIGKKARDVLYKDYAQKPPTHFNYKCLDWMFDLSCKIEAVAPGLNTVVGCAIPSAAKVELQHLRDFAAITGGIELKTNSFGGFDPVLNFSGAVGTTLFSVGTDVGFDIATRAFSELNAGLSFNSAFLIASLNLDRLDMIKASCHYTVSPQTNTAIAAELKHRFSVNETALTIGAQHAFFPFMTVKGRISTQGMVSALVQQGLWDKLFLTIAGEVDFLSSGMIPKLGVSMAFRI
ncbi:hypothetical protein FEM48_Zijuj05G0153600 [Ziziphus jujuba var. spinosa]|uniref:Mitochondrial outer membrane protein porin of 36 kDa-like n=1 Tax=Ziziphus jujuba var. spinosa TaxID=714518 RepID=A0A978VFK8_ZIZJJ|nr:hypothetical protein FEM48_Zijuj05G0153600 [Ziziphus jujuba var. spinosa]